MAKLTLISSFACSCMRDRREIELYKKPLADISTKPTNRVNAIFACEKLLRGTKKCKNNSTMYALQIFVDMTHYLTLSLFSFYPFDMILRYRKYKFSFNFCIILTSRKFKLF